MHLNSYNFSVTSPSTLVTSSIKLRRIIKIQDSDKVSLLNSQALMVQISLRETRNLRRILSMILARRGPRAPNSEVEGRRRRSTRKETVNTWLNSLFNQTPS